MKWKYFMLSASLVAFLFANCSVRKMAINQTAMVIEKGMGAIYEEDDLQLAEASIASNLKLMEVLLKNNPANERLRLVLSQAYGSYALGFLEDHDPERAKLFYQRGKNYALSVLMKNETFRKGINGSLEEFEAALQKLSKNDVPALFWCGFNWGAYIQLSLNDPQAIFDLPRVEKMMQRVLELQEDYYFAGAHLFAGSIAGAKPRLFGGNPELARQHFERVIELTDGKFMMVYIYYARFYALPMLDEELFESMLKKVLEADINILPEYRLITRLAKEKARYWLEKKNEYF